MRVSNALLEGEEGLFRPYLVARLSAVPLIGRFSSTGWTADVYEKATEREGKEHADKETQNCVGGPSVFPYHKPTILSGRKEASHMTNGGHQQPENGIYKENT
ncbi:hypothetical protein ACLOJK_030625 [Asimina triloba]